MMWMWKIALDIQLIPFAGRPSSMATPVARWSAALAAGSVPTSWGMDVVMLNADVRPKNPGFYFHGFAVLIPNVTFTVSSC
jgi:hypothetical protein